MTPARRTMSLLRPLTTFLRTESGSAVVLLGGAVAALVWANSSWAESYFNLWQHELAVGLGRFHIVEDLRHWVNDGLMTLFFFVVGLEIKREIAVGELQEPRAAVLPIVAAAGGMLAPAALYLAVNAGGEGSNGWGIPVATDIAFALGVLALLGSRVPSGLKPFLLTLAIADDVGAIIIIALVYSADVSGAWLGAAAGALLAIAAMRRAPVRSPWAYVPLGAFAWLATLESGVHATLAGVALGLMTPATPIRGRPVLEELEHRLHPISSYLVLPIFALANAGVRLDSEAIRTAVGSPVTIGIIAGLLVGKTIGVGGASWLVLRSKIGRLPLGVGMRQVWALAPLAGIGFTVSLFIADLSFGPGPLLDGAKIGVLAASLLSGALGAGLLLAAGHDDNRRSTEARAPSSKRKAPT